MVVLKVGCANGQRTKMPRDWGIIHRHTGVAKIYRITDAFGKPNIRTTGWKPSITQWFTCRGVSDDVARNKTKLSKLRCLVLQVVNLHHDPLRNAYERATFQWHGYIDLSQTWQSEINTYRIYVHSSSRQMNKNNKKKKKKQTWQIERPTILQFQNTRISKMVMNSTADHWTKQQI